MAAIKHTPGPMRVRLADYINNQGNLFVVEAKEEGENRGDDPDGGEVWWASVAEVPGGNYTLEDWPAAEAEATANLFAASPDLFAALEAFVRNPNAGKYMGRELNTARAALAKAKGES